MNVATLPTQSIREEHRELLPHVDAMRLVAHHVGRIPMEDLRRELDTVHSFLVDHLIPHAVAEDRVLYPAVAQIMRAREATATMSRDHAEVERLTRELEELRGELRPGRMAETLEDGLRRVLYGMYTLVRVHFAKEEEIYLPLLDRHLTPGEAAELSERLEAAVRAVR